MQFVGWLCSCEFDDGLTNIERRYQFIRDRSRLDVFRPSHDQRNSYAGFIQELLPANVATPVVADEKDNRVVREPVVFQLLKQLTNLTIHNLRRSPGRWPSHDAPRAGLDNTVGASLWSASIGRSGSRTKLRCVPANVACT